MKKQLLPLLNLVILLLSTATFAQRQELTISPIGFVRPLNQLVQYERYLNQHQSVTIAAGYNEYRGRYSFFFPPRTERFQNARFAVGYRYYVPNVGIDDVLTLFGSVRAVVDYSYLRLAADARFPVPSDSLPAAGFSVAPELLCGVKITMLKRVTLTGAIGGQYLFKLFPTHQITQNQDYWNAFYWTNDNQDAPYKRSQVIHYRQGWYPSVLVTLGIVLGKRQL